MDVKSSASKAVAMVLAGSFSADEGKSGGSANVEDVSVGAGSSRVQFKELIEPEAAMWTSPKVISWLQWVGNWEQG